MAFTRFCLIDFETRSRADLKKTGAWVYAEHESTEIICLGYTLGGPIDVVAPEQLVYADRRARALHEAAEDPECLFVAHNVAFEKAIWRHQMLALGWPDIPDERWHDTMASCARHGLPLKLERAAAALRLPVQKDMEGHRVLMSICKPNKKTGEFDRDPQKLRRTAAYCGVDIGTELGLHRRVRGLGADERAVWLLDQTINQRGVAIDLDFVDAAQEVVDQATGPLTKEFEALTGGLKPGQRDKVLEWLRANGANIENLQKATIDKYLGDDDEKEDTLADEDEFYAEELCPSLGESAHRALSIRRILGSASIKKLAAIRACTCNDGRARGLLQYHGAGPGRWAGRLLQPQNFPRPTLKEVVGFKDDGEEILGGHDAEALVAAIKSRDAEFVRCLYGEPIEAVANGLRHALVAGPEKSLAVGDYSKIECVIVLALAGATETAADVIRRGSAVYTDMAAKIFKRPVSKHELKEYTVGKASVLGSGFQMGWPKFKKRYAEDLPDEVCQAAIAEYREHFAPEVPKFWRAIEDAALRTVIDRVPHEAYGIQYALEDSWLTCRLPSGRKLYYFAPEECRKRMPWDPDDIRLAWRYSAMKAGRWTKVDAYGGHLVENIVQATARDLLVHGLFNCEREGLPVILTVHDEAVCEVDAGRADPKLLEHCLTDAPPWAYERGIPVAAECWAGPRYKK